MAVVEPKDNPATQSQDYIAMLPAWQMIEDILAGCAKVKEKGVVYLPKYAAEGVNAYQRRLIAAPWRPEFDDALRSLCSKPFTKPVTLNQEAPEVLLGKVANEKTKERRGGLVDDIDGQGNSLHVFARDTFQNGVAFGLEAIYVTYPDGQFRTAAEEKLAGVRPYWVHVRAKDIIDLKLKVVGGYTKVSHIRIRECTREADGFAEVEVERIRVVELDAMNRPVWRLFRKDKEGVYQDDGKGSFTGVNEIPIALFFTGPRSGNYYVKPPLRDLIDMQLEIYRKLSAQEQLITLTSPMLVMKGVKPPEPTPILDSTGRQTGERPAPQQEVGPGTIIYAYSSQDGVQPSADYIQPSAQNMAEVREDIGSVIQDFRRLALQPTTPRSGNMIATGQAIDAAKAHTAVEAWANGLVDALNQALVFTCQWLKIADTVTAQVFTDFGIDIAGVEEMKVLGDASKRTVISKKQEAEELSRRNLLGPTYDYKEDQMQLAKEEADGGVNTDDEGIEPKIDPVTGQEIEQSIAA